MLNSEILRCAQNDKRQAWENTTCAGVDRGKGNAVRRFRQLVAALLAPAAALLALAAAASVARAADDLKLNIDTEFGWGGCFRPGEWLPVDVTIHSAEPTFAAVLTLTGPQDEHTSLTVVHPCVLVPDVPVHAPLATRIAPGTQSLSLRVRSESDGRSWEKTHNLWDYEADKRIMVSVGEKDLLVVVVGEAGAGLKDVPRNGHCYSVIGSSSGAGRVYVRERPPLRLPWDWTAYAAADAVVLYDPDWSVMREAQKRALVEWVQGGGRLVMVLGRHPLPSRDPLRALVPVAVGDARRVEQAGVRADGQPRVPAGAVTAWDLGEPSAPGWRRVSDDGDTAHLAAAGPVGFGRVAVLAFDPAALPAGDDGAGGSVAFWNWTLAHVLEGKSLRTGKADDDNSGYYGYYYTEPTAGSRCTDALLAYLLDIPELMPISIIWVVLLMGGMVLVIGPIDYLMLKRRDRLPLTWLTLVCYVAGFSALAFLGVRALKAGGTQMRVAGVVDAVQGEAGAWASRYGGVYASSAGVFQFTGLDETQWWSPLAPGAGRYSYRAVQSGGSRHIQCLQQDGGCVPVSVPIAIWSMQCMLQEGRHAAAPPLRVRMGPQRDRAHAVIENLADTPVAEGYVVIAPGLVARFGAIPARGRLDLDEAGVHWPGWKASVEEIDDVPMRYPFGRTARALVPDNLFLSTAVARRTEAMRRLVEDGAAVVCARYDDPPATFGLEDRFYDSSRVEWVRLVVYREKDPL
jgi:hypothetical protein